METGIIGKSSETVIFSNTAASVGSGLLDVYATPAMIALMEKTAYESVMPYLEEGQGTVGISMNVKHVSASPIGANITCESKLVEIDRKRLVFEVKAYDNAGLIGEGIHERFIIENEKFLTKAKAKLD